VLYEDRVVILKIIGGFIVAYLVIVGFYGQLPF
jgi:hypothetical protein